MTWQEAFDILELSNPKTLEELREAYSIQVKAWHPDRFESDAKMQRIGTARMKLINEAFRYLRENWSKREDYLIRQKVHKAPIPVGERRTGPREIVTVLEHARSVARKTGITFAAKRIHEYLGDATISAIFSDHRSRELRLKVGEAVTIEFGKSARYEIRLLQVRQVYKSRRGMPFPLFYPAADLAVTRLA
ncbi:MAG TPA: J domain-containing protein [Candidatus Kryptonia bacterium]